MEWIKPGNYSRNRVDKAGEIVIKARIPQNLQEENEAYETFANWRGSHAYPMHIIMKNLKTISKNLCHEAICVQRLKRAKSLLIKLRRFHGMKLSRIEDIGGCRVIMPNVELARRLAEEYISKNKRHKRVKEREKNYINNPKDDGYRSIHLVYAYNSRNKIGKKFNGRLVEIQIRSKIQHLWATALETVDLFTPEKMKLGKGKPSWQYFFKLVSSAFAMNENCPTVPGAPTNKDDLYKEIRRMASPDVLNVIERLQAMRTSVAYLSERKNALFVLRLDVKNQTINFSAFKNDKDGWSKANENYLEEERKYHNDDYNDVVLVGAENMSDIKHAYTNYFVDTSEFITHLKKIIELLEQ